jgi:3-oxoadipate enol-lactonase
VRGRSGSVRAEDGVSLAWRADGPPDAPPLLLCTMATAGMAVWDPVVDGLADRWLVIRHDRRGEGDSDPGAPESHSFATYSRDGQAVLDRLEQPAAHVCGMAFGSRVALRLTLDAPQRVLSLALFDATGGPPAGEAQRRAGNQHAASLRAAAGLPDVARDPAWFARRDPAGAGLAVHALKGQPDWTPGLSAIPVPTLVACGEQDPNFEGAQRLAREIPHARFAPMPMTGHGSIIERPDLVLALLRGFLEDA